MPAPKETPRSAPGLQGHFVSFRLDDEAYALPLERVERALRMVAPVPLPQGPGWLTGVINLHGQVVPVLDLGQLFGQEPRRPDPGQRLLVVPHQPRKLALLVDKVEQVIQAQASQVEPPSGHLAESRVLAGVLRHKDDLILVLDPERLTPPDWPEQEELLQALEEQAAPKDDLE